MFDDDPTLFTSLATQVSVDCPFCGETNDLVLDPATRGALVQDCEVCCRPWDLHVAWDADGQPTVRANAQ